MRYTGTYAIVLVLHLLTVVFVVGPTVLAPPLAARAARDGRVDALRDHLRTTRVYGIATIVTVLLGTAMVGLGDIGDQWGFGQAWISAAYALWFVAVVLLLAVAAPAMRKAVTALESSQTAGSFAGRISAGGGLAALAFTAVIVLMVLKPGA